MENLKPCPEFVRQVKEGGDVWKKLFEKYIKTKLLPAGKTIEEEVHEKTDSREEDKEE